MMTAVDTDTAQLVQYRIIDDSGVPYDFIGDYRSWVGQIVEGSEVRTTSVSPYPHITINKPYGLAGTFTASPEMFLAISPAEQTEPQKG
jgi:hypothetical protein